MQTAVENIEPETKGYTVERLSNDNIAELALLHKEVYGTDPGIDYFQKKYDTAYTGTMYAGLIAYNDDKIPVAYYGVVPCLIKYNDIIILAAQSVDTMTHPKHRFKGMFVELSNLTFELCRSLGIKLIFGFPNQNSYHGAVTKLGWKLTEEMVYFSIPVKALPWQKITRKLGLKKMYDNRINRVIGKNSLPLPGLPNSVINDGYAGVYRNDAFLQYKQYNPSKVIAVAGAKAWISIKGSMMIGDMEGVNANNFDEVIIRMKKLAAKAGIRQIQFHCSPGTALYKLFASKFKPAPSYPALFQDLGSAIEPGKIKFSFADIDVF